MEHTKTRHLFVVGSTVLILLSRSTALSQEKTVPACQVARPIQRPVGAPNASDVIMRTLTLHPRNRSDPHSTREAIEDFHVTRLEWSYVTNREFIGWLKASGRVFGGAAAAPSFLPGDDVTWFEKVVIVNADGEPIIAPWKRTWKRTLWGCINNPELERGYLQYLKGYIDAGAQVMQRDEPGANFNATRWGGCFCQHCMRGFRQFLHDNTTPDERRQMKIADLDSFDYRRHVKDQNAPVGDPFGRWDGGRLKELFVQFQTEASVAFHRRTRQAINEYAGRHVPFSCNNGAHRWSPIELEFDWVFGELSYGRATGVQLHAAMGAATEHGRVQVVTMPKKGDRENLDEWQRRTRQTIATAYACGGLCMVPWDVYMPKDAPRYFGTPEQYADLFGFIRANAAYLDGYYEAAATGPGINEIRYGAATPVDLGEGSEGVFAFVRAKPGQPKAPVVVHLVSWSAESKPVTLRLRRPCFFGDKNLATKLRVPVAYDEQAHKAAEETGSFSSLSSDSDLATTNQGAFSTVQVPPVKPWAILVVSPAS
jgi:hypothetical protein